MATPAPMPQPKPLLELAGLSKSFGGLVVIDELDLVVNEHEVVSVIGPNGAGKTTLFNLITGIYPPDAGEIRLDGESLLGLPAHRITRKGVAPSPRSTALNPRSATSAVTFSLAALSSPAMKVCASAAFNAAASVSKVWRDSVLRPFTTDAPMGFTLSRSFSANDPPTNQGSLPAY